MIQLKKGNIILDTSENMVIERERMSPFFSVDEIPGEVSIPFALPPSDLNLKALGAIDQVPVKKDATHDILIKDGVFQISHAKLAIESIETDLNINNSGSISAYSLSNISEFYQRIKNKKLQELTLGGLRTFTWDGYNTTGTGFWAHVHNTWQFSGSREYCFYPIYNPGYKGFTKGWMNQLKEYSGVREMARDENTTALCPAVNLVYLLKQIFEEVGYKLTGTLLNDNAFSSITIPSFYGVYWADGVYVPEVPEIIILGTVVQAFVAAHLDANPLATITINLQEHVPPDTLISSFLVELQKFMPVGFEINDNTRTCEILMLSDISPVGAVERYSQIGSFIKTELDKEQKIYALEREGDSADEFDLKADIGSKDETETWKAMPMVYAVGSTVYVKDIGEYWKLTSLGSTIIWQPVFPNPEAYKPEGSTDSIGSKITTMPLSEQEMFQATTIGIHGYFPACNQEGNWKNKASKFNKWGIRFLFFKEALPYGNTGFNLPFAYPSNYHINGPDTNPHQKVFDWSLCLINSTDDGLYEKHWKPWLKTFANREKIFVEWRPSLSEYVAFKWKTPFLVNNTPYMVEKIKDKLPYDRPGDPTSESVAVEARRMN